MSNAIRLFLLLCGLLAGPIHAAQQTVKPEDFGAVGDGRTDDSTAVQRALSKCSSVRAGTCEFRTGARYRITRALFAWGSARIAAFDGSSALVFDVESAPYLFNFGISGRRKLEQPFSGTVSGLTFEVTRGPGGRLLYFWRTRDAIIEDNTFLLGTTSYSATSSGNHNDWVLNGDVNCIRENLTIRRNRIFASGTDEGSEGIGLGQFHGATIEGNQIDGVGDDPIGVHFSQDVSITSNRMTSVDGRILVANSQRVTIVGNVHRRVASEVTNRFYRGISLLYIGYETTDIRSLDPPRDTIVRGNRLEYPQGAIDAGAAIYVYGAVRTLVEGNVIQNDSPHLSAIAVYVLPQRPEGGLALKGRGDRDRNGMVRGVAVIGNTSQGRHALAMGMSGNCAEYDGEVLVKRNVAAKYTFYCDFANVSDNTINPKE